MKYSFYIFIILCLSCNTSPKTGKAQKINADTLSNFNEFQEEIKQNLKLSNLKLLGNIETATNRWLIIEGTINDPTYEDSGIFIYPEKKDELPDSIMKRKYSNAGKEFSFEDTLVYESRVFFGECTSLHKNSIIWYQRERNKEKWDTSVFVIDFNDKVPAYSFVTKNGIGLDEILKNVQNKNCKEIPGKIKHDEP